MPTMSSTAPQHSLIFEEDEVSRVGEDGTKEFGLIIETSEYISSDEEEYEEEEEVVKKGSVRVAWFPDGKEQVIDETALTLEDRSLMPGDVVRRLISGTNSQRGFVKDMTVLCDVRVIGSDKIMRGIDARQLLRTEEWDGESELLTLDSWVGRVEGVTLDVVVRFPDNSSMELINVDMMADGFNDVSDSKRDEDSEFRSKVFYEGQVLEEPHSTILERDHEWRTESKIYNKPHSKHCNKKVKVVVEEVVTRQLDVHWMCRGYAETDTPTANLQMPSRTIDEDAMHRLRRLDYFEHCSIQIGDRAYFVVPNSKSADTEAKRPLEADAADVNGDTPDCCHEPSPAKGPSKTEATDPVSSETANGTTMDVDQNGTNTTENSSQNKPKESESENVQNTEDKNEAADANNVEDMELNGDDADGEYESDSEEVQVQEKSRKRTNSGGKQRVHISGRASATPRRHKATPSHRPRKKKAGSDKVPVEVIHTLSYVDVMWQDGVVENRIPSYDLYPIHHLDELEFFPGDFIVRADAEGPSDKYGVVSRVDHQARTCLVKWVMPYQIGVTDRPVEEDPMEMSVYDIKDHPDYKFRPDQVIVRVCGYENTPGCREAAGQIIDIEQSGELVVYWPDGQKSNAFPQEVFLIQDETSDYGSSEWGSDQDDSVCSWETESEQTETDTDNEIGLIEDEAPGADGGGGNEEVKEKKKKKKEEKEVEGAAAKDASEEGLNLGPGDKLELDYHLDRLETALERPMQPDVIDRVVECYRNVLTVHKQCLDLDRLLGSNYFDDKDLMSVISQVRRELRREKQNKMQTHLLQQAQSYVAARKCMENGRPSSPPTMDREACEGSDTQVPKSKSEPNLGSKQQQIKFVKNTTDGLETVEDIEGELCASLEKARGICSSALKALRKQIMKVREQLEAMWKKKLDQIKKETGELEEEEEEFAGATAAVQAPELMSPLSPDQSRSMPTFEQRFVMTSDVPSQHNFYSREHTPQDMKAFNSAVRKEMKLLTNNLPAGIKVVGFDERMDLYSVLVVGPSRTPYEDGLFFFDVQLPNSYPAVPPSFHYISFCTDRLNPNLYDDGKVCVSLLGTWGGKGTELWSSSSNMLQVLVSIQGLILNDEPYYNEAGYEKQRGSQMGMENSKVYNEMAILKLVQSMMKIVKNPPNVFKDDVIEHMKKNGLSMIRRLESWIELTDEANKSSQAEADPDTATPTTPATPTLTVPATPISKMSAADALCENSPGAIPDFPLIPASRGFCLTLRTHLNEFRNVLKDNDML